jgi:hypothetical protein
MKITECYRNNIAQVLEGYDTWATAEFIIGKQGSDITDHIVAIEQDKGDWGAYLAILR